MRSRKHQFYGLHFLLNLLIMFALWAIPAQAGMGGGMSGGISGGGVSEDKEEPSLSPEQAEYEERKKRRPAELKDVLWDREKEGQVRIFVQPAAFLYIDGEVQKDPKGKQQKSEKFVAAIPVGEHVIKMSMDGYQPSEKKISIEAGKPYSVNFVLIKEGMKLGETISIPAGEFWMGLDEFDLDFVVQKIGGEKRYHKNESPRRKVNVKAFYIDKYDVTNMEYKKFLEATKHKGVPDNWEDGEYPAGQDLHPVTYVSWDDADAYCKWAGKRLPVEMEWEKAARWAPDKVMGAEGADSTLYPWGNTFHRLKANTGNGGAGKTTVVGQYEEGKSAYGVYDMAGNVKQWTADWYEDYPGAKFEDVFTAGDKVKVARGGSFMDRDYDCLSTCRFKISPGSGSEDLGFRCAKDTK